eukprot:Protomagalhaensia_sp_Gyna_25__4726@NODE_462_length_3372_cov_173_184218_g357_i0_p1_GENE_NODE_462_length_3372_cov_173_184218_g357_i0NODE_462_length_3372_cov_173_184218_g357_i0_p1_ORF_typecomplete_len348_score76_54Aldo_ket_red/PF00248_21/0_22Aldo_ket_red/PF00248_21/2_4e40_NODE_462_length_3372_cov_173_184218_g357_i020713114
MRVPVVQLSNGVYIPVLGLGSYGTEDPDSSNTLLEGLKYGYRSIDDAEYYGNYPSVKSALERYEKDPGCHNQDCCCTKEPILPSGMKVIDQQEWLENFSIPHGGKGREDKHTIFVTTKIWPTLSGEKVKSTIANFQKATGRSQADLVLLHWPGLSQQFGGSAAEEGDAEGNEKKRFEAWNQLEEEYAQGRARAIGVSNFMVKHLKPLMADIEKRKREGDPKAVFPVLNQIEISPWLLPPDELVDYCKANNITLQGYAPLGARKKVQEHLADPLVNELAKKYNKSPANIILRAMIQRGFIVLAKSSKVDRVLDNFGVFDFEIEEEDMKDLETLNKHQIRTTADPNLIG